MNHKKPWQKWGVGLGAGAALLAAGCSQIAGDDKDGFSSEEWASVKNLEPLTTPQPVNPYNNRCDDPVVAKLGQMIFFETDGVEPLPADNALGKKGESPKFGCVSCHDPKKYFVDSRPDPTSLGRTGFGGRNTPTMVNVGWNPWAGWLAQHDSLNMHGAGVIGTLGSRLWGIHYVYKKYRDEYNAAFPSTPLDPALDPAAPDAARFPATGSPKANAMAADGPWEKMTPDDQKAMMQVLYNLGRTWDAYPRMLVTRNSAFERYVEGEYTALSPEAKRGLRLFIGKAACNECHNGPALSDGLAHNIGVPMAATATAPDMGRYAAIAGTLANPFNGAGEFSDDREAGRAKLATLPSPDTAAMDALKGAFRTPQLLNIAETGPYFHTGQVRSLEEVVRHYNRGGGEPSTFAGTKDPKVKPLGLTDSEVTDLVEFLKSLTGSFASDEWTKDIAKH